MAEPERLPKVVVLEVPDVMVSTGSIREALYKRGRQLAAAFNGKPEHRDCYYKMADSARLLDLEALVEKGARALCYVEGCDPDLPYILPSGKSLLNWERMKPGAYAVLALVAGKAGE